MPEGHPVLPPHLSGLRRQGIQAEGVCDFMVRSTTLARFKIAIAENILTLSRDEASALADWVYSGGTLISTVDLGTKDEIGRARPNSIVADLLRLPRLQTCHIGKGELIVVPAEQLSRTVVEVADEAIKLIGAQTTNVELRAYESKSGDLALHIVNYGPDMKGPFRLGLPARLIGTSKRATFRSPERLEPLKLDVVGQTLQVPAIKAYGVVEIAKKDDAKLSNR
jgi:hypothetical protein